MKKSVISTLYSLIIFQGIGYEQEKWKNQLGIIQGQVQVSIPPLSQ